MTVMQSALFLPPFDDLAEPRALMEIAVAAEERGWDGVFLWDHVMRSDPPRPVGDPWIILAAMAAVTTRIRIGPLVTPLVRRRPQKLVREIVTLDRLSHGRLTVGLGLGVDTGRELSAFGEVVGSVERGDVLDEGLALLQQLLSGQRVRHVGTHFTADNVKFLPTAVQRPHPPLWMATRSMNRRPLRRAALANGLVPIEINPTQLREMVGVVGDLRGGLSGFDVTASESSGFSADAWAAAGATWWLADLEPGVTVADVMARIAAGPLGG